MSCSGTKVKIKAHSLCSQGGLTTFSQREAAFQLSPKLCLHGGEIEQENKGGW